MTASTQNATEAKTDAAEPQNTPDKPLLDLNNSAVKRMIKEAKKRGYVTVDQLNSVLPSEEVTSEQIEDTMSMLSDIGINVVESDEADDSDDDDDENEGSDSRDLVEAGSTAVAKKTTKRDSSAHGSPSPSTPPPRLSSSS